MNAFKIISEIKEQIEYFKSTLDAFKDQQRLKRNVEFLNKVIQLMNFTEEMIDMKISQSALDRVVLGYFYSQIMRYSDRSKDVPVQYIFNKITDDLELPIEEHRKRIIEFMQDKERDQIFRDLPLTADCDDYMNCKIDFNRMAYKDERNLTQSILQAAKTDWYDAKLDEMIDKLHFGIEFKNMNRWN